MPDADSHEHRSPALAELAARGYLEQASDLAGLDEALAKGVVTFYNGYDPTADSLHVGHLLTIMAMRLIQKHGHKPLPLVGGGTAMVGDPSGKTETRKILTIETIKENAVALRSQFARYVHFDRGVEHDAELIDNSDWLLGLRYVEFLRDIGRHFTVNRMIAAKTYRDRLESELPLSFLEFNYQLLQAYDFLHLYQQRGCTLQVGGSDQWGNMVAGVELIRRHLAAERAGSGEETDGAKDTAFCLTYPLLTTADGSKMGKTERGALWLDPDRVSPFDFYQYWINVDDRDVPKLLRLYTEIELEEVEALSNLEGAAIREAKTRLAHAVTTLAHGEEEANKARDASQQAFGGGDDWSSVPCVELQEATIGLVDLVVHDDIKAFKSKREARQRIEGGAVKLDGEQLRDPNHVVNLAAAGDDGLRLQAGKKTRFRVRQAPGASPE